MKTTIPAALLRAAPMAVLLFSSSALLAAAPATPQGIITAREFLNIGGGTTVGDLTNNAKFPNSPDAVNYRTLWEWPANPDGSKPSETYRDAYDIQIIGYFYPTTTGPQTFSMASDDNGVLFLSTDENPANKRVIASVPGCTTSRQYDKYPEQMSAAINLTAGRPYYIEALMKEGGGGDNLSVSIDGTDPIPGSQLSSFDRVSATAPYVTRLIGHGSGFYFQIQEVAGGTQVNQSSVQVTFDNASITPRVTKVGNVVVVAYQTPAVLVIGSSHSATLTFADNATSPLTQTVTRGFAVGPYTTIPPGYAISTPPTDPGMKVQVYQIDFVRDPGDENSIP